MENSIKFVIANLDTIKAVAELGVFLVLMLSSSARGAIAAVNDILKGGVGMTDEQALQKASDLMGKKLPYIPDALRKMIIQWLFDSMKNVVKKNAAPIKQ
ncbi:MAG: hypothetical protein WC529_08810 [Candidatus Margulisiibacteriota bacterium]